LAGLLHSSATGFDWFNLSPNPGKILAFWFFNLGYLTALLGWRILSKQALYTLYEIDLQNFCLPNYACILYTDQIFLMGKYNINWNNNIPP
jgi:hypothetical protein